MKVKIPKGAAWLDYSTLSLFMRCPRSYFWRVIQHVTTEVESAALTNGTAYHEAKAVYLKAIIDGYTHEEAVDMAIKAMTPIMYTIANPDSIRNISVANRTLRNYFEYWKDSHYRPKEVEIGFAIDLISFFFIGRSDSFEEFPLGKIVMETKTTSIVGERWQYRNDPNLQIDGYVAARYITTNEMPYGGVLDVIPLHKDKTISPFRILAPRKVEDVDRWVNEVQDWWELINICRDSNRFPRHTEMCIPLVGFACDYRALCKRFPSPHKMQEIELPGDYAIKEWKPIDIEIEEVA